jgi:hypothetical protein
MLETLHYTLPKVLWLHNTAFLPSTEELTLLLCEEGEGTPPGGWARWGCWASVHPEDAGFLALRSGTAKSLQGWGIESATL